MTQISDLMLKQFGDQIPDHLWELDGVSDDGLRRYYSFTDPASGVTIRKTENVIEVPILELNRQMWNDSDGQRWGDGKVAARVPLNVYFDQIAPRRREGDNDFMKWFLNRDENRKYRTFKGKGSGRL